MDFQMLAVSAATLLAVSIGYFFIRRHLVFQKYRNGSNIPFIPNKSYISGSYRTIASPGFSSAEKLEELFKTVSGNFLGMFMGDLPVVFTKDLDLLYKVWVTDNAKHGNRMDFGAAVPVFYHSLMMAKDENWRRVRKAIGSTLTPSKLKLSNLEQVIQGCLDNMIGTLKKKATVDATTKVRSIVVDSSKLFKEFTMDISLDSSLDQAGKIDYGLEHNEIVVSAELMGKEGVNSLFTMTQMIRWLAPIVRFLSKPLKLSKFLSHVEMTVKDIVANAQKRDSREARTRPKIIDSLLKLHEDKRITTDELVANSFIILLSSWDTTGQTLVALMWQLARNPDVQEKLRDSLLKHGAESQYLDWTIKETLRLNPASNTSRCITEDIDWTSANNGQQVKIMKGMNLILNPYSIHRDKTIWGADVMEFNPERFDKSDKFHPAQFTPFGLGPRNCIGYYMAQSILKNAVTRIVTSYKIQNVCTTPSKLELQDSTEVPAFLFCLKGKVPLNFIEVSNNSNNNNSIEVQA